MAKLIKWHNFHIVTVIAVLIVLTAIVLVTVLIKNNLYGFRYGNAITQEETALKIGVALLENRYSDSFIFFEGGPPNLEFEVVEKNRIWRVSTVYQDFWITQDGRKVTLEDAGGYFVEFRKDNGKVIKIGHY